MPRRWPWLLEPTSGDSSPTTSSVDIAIRFGDGNWAESVATPLFDTLLVPVCSPTYTAKNGRPLEARNILEHTLLQSLCRRDDWTIWLTANGLGRHAIKKSLAFEGDGLAYQAALEGVGIALARSGLFEPDAAAGKIVTLLDKVLPARAPGAYYVVQPAGERLSPTARTFREWILTQVHPAARLP